MTGTSHIWHRLRAWIASHGLGGRHPSHMNAVLTIEDARGPGREDRLAEGMVGDKYDTTLTASGGSGRYQWTLVSPPTLPSGLKPLDRQAGKISGRPDRLAEGPTHITVQVDDGNTTTSRTFLLRINPGLRISPGPDIKGSSIELKATGGCGPYKWTIIDKEAVQDWLALDEKTGIITVSTGHLEGLETKHFAVRVEDAAREHHTDVASFSVMARATPWWRHPFHRKISGRDVGLRAKRRWPSFGRLSHLSFWLYIFAIATPTFGAIWIFVYAFRTPGSHGSYLAVGMLTATAAFLIGCLTGFLFGIPRLVSSGQARFGQSTGYTPSSNLSEVSDWLTKLLLGAGLVQLTHLGTPIGKLIHTVAAGLYSSAPYSGAATATAGAIIFGYFAIGLLYGYVITTMWYQRKLTQANL
jgi:Putative Ig domain